MPLLVLFAHLLLIPSLVLIQLVSRTRFRVEVLVTHVPHSLVIDLLDQLVLQRLVIQVHLAQDLLDLVVVRVHGVCVQPCQYVLLLALLEHLEDGVNELEGADSLAGKLLERPLLGLGVFGDLNDELLECLFVGEIYLCEILLDDVLVALLVQGEQTCNDLLPLLSRQHSKYGIVCLKTPLSLNRELLRILALHLI